MPVNIGYQTTKVAQLLGFITNFLASWGTSGSGPGQFVLPEGVAADSQGNVWVVDRGNRVEKFSNSGTFLLQIGGGGTGNGQESKYKCEAERAGPALKWHGNFSKYDW